MMNTKCKTFNVLSIDGGGIRGIIPAMILKKIEKETKRPIHDLFDLIAGTSTGGIIALALTMPDCNGNPKHSAKDLVNLYKYQGHRIFNRSDLYKNLSFNGYILRKYPTGGIKNVLRDFFGDTCLSQALTDVLIPSYDMQGTRLYWKDWKEYKEGNKDSFRRKGGHPRFFKSHQAKQCNLPQENYLMWKVAHATAAAPTFFAPVNTEFTPHDDKPCENLIETLIDGGIFANNPAMCAYAEAKRMLNEKAKELEEKIKENELDENERDKRKSELNEIEEKKIFIVSLGTGHLTNILDPGIAKIWGKFQWVVPLLKNIIFDGASDTVNYQLKQLLDEKMYYRLQPFLPESCDEMDNVNENNLKDLQEEATSFMENNEDLINSMIERLTEVESQNT